MTRDEQFDMIRFFHNESMTFRAPDTHFICRYEVGSPDIEAEKETKYPKALIILSKVLLISLVVFLIALAVAMIGCAVYFWIEYPESRMYIVLGLMLSFITSRR